MTRMNPRNTPTCTRSNDVSVVARNNEATIAPIGDPRMN